jgi:hypothetical protein
MSLRTALLGIVLAPALAMPAGAQVVVHLTFDNPASLGADSSGNDNNGSLTGSPAYDASGISGGAVYFDGSSYIGFGSTVAATLAGNFSASLWLKTIQVTGNSTDQGFSGTGIVYADVPGYANDTIPIALNGNVAGFDTNNGSGDSTLHSISAINTGSYVHIVVTRDNTTGLKAIYVNGALENTEPVSTAPFNGRNLILLGANDVDNRYLIGTVDDFQFYSTALAPGEVTFLFNNPGLTVAAIPEPGTRALLGAGLGLIGVVFARGRHRNRTDFRRPHSAPRHRATAG